VNDVIDGLAGLTPDSPLAELRARRGDFVRYSQGSYDVLLHPADPGGLSLDERAAVARTVAEVNADAGLTAHYRGLIQSPLAETPRLAALLAHAALVARTPRAATPAALQALADVGLSTRDTVVLSQLIAFVSYQTRVLSGLALLQRGSGA
jgi:uncharacterized protein YciW